MNLVRIAVVAGVLLLVAACGGPHDSGPARYSSSADVEAQGTADPNKTTTTTAVRSQGQPDPCKVFTQEEVAGFTGGAVAKGVPTGTGQSCSYAAVDSGGVSFLVTFTSSDSHEKFLASRQDASAQGPQVQDLLGIGDEAFSYGSADSGVQSAEARKGGIRVRVLLQGKAAAPERARAALVKAVAAIPG